jgi:hypothetical protein
MLRDWLVHHPRTVRVFLLGIVAFNGWISHLIYPQHPQLAIFHAALAGLLLGGVIVSWRSGGSA